MTDTKQTKIQLKNRQRIMDAALEIFSTYGYRGSTIELVAQAAEMSKSSVFYYFGSKTEIYVALLTKTIDGWLEPLKQLDENGDPSEEIWAYVQRKLEMSRNNPKASRLFANEILHGAPNIMDILKGDLKPLLDEKCLVLKKWIEQGKLVDVSPHHLIFMIWASTQHYADFEVQVDALIEGCEDRDECFNEAEATLRTIFLNGLLPR